MSCVFCCISQRALYGHLLVLADAPNNDPAAVKLQGIFREIWYNLYDDPALLELPCFGDESYPWNVVNNKYPELDAKYKDIFKVIYEFWRFLLTVSLNGVISEDSLFISSDAFKAAKASFKPFYSHLLEKSGFSVKKVKIGISLSHTDTDILKAMQALAMAVFTHIPVGKPDYYVKSYSLFEFMRCSFDGKWEYIIDRIDYEQNMDGLLIALAKRCRESGYTFEMHPECNASSTSGFGIDIMRGVGGFHITYNPRKTQKFGFGTKNGLGEKKMLEKFAALDDDMQQHFIDICRTCNLCMGCTKGGKNKPFTVNVTHNGTEHAICPQFPKHEWDSLTHERIETLFRYHELQEAYNK